MKDNRNVLLQKELANELNRMQVSGTSYRLETARLATTLSRHVMVPESLCDREEARQYVKAVSMDLQEDRVEDVAKMLSMAARRAYTTPESSFSVDMKVKLEEKRSQFKTRGLRVKS
jgi:hypothetical protein